MIRLLRESLAVLLVGIGLGLTANHLNGDGLDLTRNHFPRSVAEAVGAAGGSRPAPPAHLGSAAGGPRAATPGDGHPAAAGTAGAPQAPAGAGGAPRPAAAPAAGTAGAPPAAGVADEGEDDHAGHGHAGPEELAATLTAQGLGGVVAHDEVVARFRDELYPAGHYVFVDARDDAAYAEGHIPGAFQLDPYHPDRYLAELLPAAQGALDVVVYCNGGDCEDSITAAFQLVANGVNPAVVRVYPGGITRWRAADLPIETGARGSAAADQ